MMEIKNENLYKYQIETLKELNQIVNQLETKTKENYSIKIGEYKHYYHNGYNWVTDVGSIYLNINTLYYGYHSLYKNFVLDYNICDGCEDLNINDLFNWDIKIKLDNDIFLKINKTIDKIIKDNKEREEFHEKLNMELQALNKILGD